MNKIIFISYGEPMASSRYRAEQYYYKMNNNSSKDFFVEYYTIYPKNIKSFFSLPLMFLKKIFSLYKCIKFDIVFLQRNPVNFLSPFYEMFIKYILRKKIIFDFDDSLWVLKGKYDKRVERIISLSDLVIVGNKFLYDYAIKFNNNVHILNTVIDTKKCNSKNRLKNEKIGNRLGICWIGSKSTTDNLNMLEPVFVKIKEKYGGKLDIFIVSDERPGFEFFNEYNYIKWSKETEHSILLKSDIGIMPLADSIINKGKCGFKLIQYGAYELASIATPIGINKEIIREGVNGFLVSSEQGWIYKLSYLIDNPFVLNKMKIKSRKIIEDHYSLDIVFDRFLALIALLLN